MPDAGGAGDPVACSRMYDVTPAVRALWWAFLSAVARRAGVPLRMLEHAAPAPIETLWEREDLGCTLMCGLPFSMAQEPPRLIAALRPAGARYGGRPVYFTDIAVRADSPFRTLEDTFGGVLGWTVEHSQSGFSAPRRHLARHAPDGRALYRDTVGPLRTVRRVVEALVAGEIDVGPLDSYWHDLLRRHEPDTAALLRVVATTEPTPSPAFVASRTTPDGAVAAMRTVLLGADHDPELAPMLEELSLAGFAAVEPADYAPLLAAAREAEAGPYPRPR